MFCLSGMFFLPLLVFGWARCQTLWQKRKIKYIFLSPSWFDLSTNGGKLQNEALQKGHSAFGILLSQALQLMGNTGDAEGHQNHHGEHPRQHECMSLLKSGRCPPFIVLPTEAKREACVCGWGVGWVGVQGDQGSKCSADLWIHQ